MEERIATVGSSRLEAPASVKMADLSMMTDKEEAALEPGTVVYGLQNDKDFFLGKHHPHTVVLTEAAKYRDRAGAESVIAITKAVHKLTIVEITKVKAGIWSVPEE